jgi:hypothetical protein
VSKSVTYHHLDHVGVHSIVNGTLKCGVEPPKPPAMEVYPPPLFRRSRRKEKPSQPFVLRWMAEIRLSHTPSRVIILALDLELNGPKQIPMP